MDSFPGVSLSSPLDVGRRAEIPQSLSSSMSGIAAVATRIQERANELNSQLALASLAESELEQEQERLDAQEKENASVRRTMLSAVQSRHSIELELWQAQDDASLLNSKTERIYEQTHDLKARTATLKDEWENVAQNTYANHETETTLFQRRMEGLHQRRERRHKRREKRLDKLALKAEMYREEASAMHCEREALREQLNRMDEEEEQEDERIASHAIQVKEILAKRAKLRDELELAKEEHQKTMQSEQTWNQS